ncbi:hypothetical protein [Candidatus Ichthyocystis hellenicum]|uniref:hypothetical protein n=1 Tax=Candidatus Ichthyocystis hellenicum TaxID=1561003 RepID=UPI000B8786B1|nr:hypothetical protein [Candidatus Ichthyocystis hellenicum]
MCVYCGSKSNEESIYYVFNCQNSINVLMSLSRDEFSEVTFILDRGNVGFSMYEPIYESTKDDIYQSVLVGLAVKASAISSCSAGLLNSIADSKPSSDDTSSSSFVYSVPDSWYYFCERNCDIYSNPRELKSLLKLIDSLSDILDDSCKIVDGAPGLLFGDLGDIDRDCANELLESVLSKIDNFIYDFKGLRIKIRKSISCLVEALLLQLSHLLMLGYHMASSSCITIIPLELPKVALRLSNLIKDTKLLVGAISSVTNLCHFIPLEEVIEIFEKRDPCSYKDEISMMSSILGSKYPDLIGRRKLIIAQVVSRFSENDASDFLKKLNDDIREMENFIEKHLGVITANEKYENNSINYLR